ncbi:hypothetical protein MNBD_IGNAVI01-404 [hydrothermal vent metagenome]|uniref:Sodium-solute symporter n=1 Tax=hydrothermal vent metagenome TaxID=652676 RepID=A0A3B1CAS9_9ZZZZ
MQNVGINTIDIIIALSYIIGTVGVGFYFLKEQKSAKDFLMAGRSMSWLPVGLSLMATLTSAVGYMAYPAGAFKSGLILFWMAMAIPISYPVVVYVFMPFYHKLKLYTAYEYLEKRFDKSVRGLGSGIFIIWRLTWMAAVLYVPSMVLNVVSDGKIPLIPSIIVLGIVGILMTTLGGVKAVMWGDVFHSAIMFLGMFLVIFFIISAVPGGVTKIWDTLGAAGKTQMTGNIPGFGDAGLFSKIHLYLITDFTIVSIIITYTIQKMGNYCVDQAMVQRYITASSLKESQKGFLANAGAYLLYIVLVTIIGAGLFTVAKNLTFPTSLKIDHIYPYFIANFLPTGVVGILLASIYAASLSSINGGINSITTAILNDFYAPYKLKQNNLEIGENSEEEKARRLKISRISTILIGLVAIIMAFFVEQLGDIFTYSQKLINMFTGPLFGIFLLGMLTKRATAPAVLVAGFLGFIFGSLLVFGPKMGIDSLAVGVLWPATISFVVTIVIGYALSFVIGENNKDRINYTRKNVMLNENL